jgi:hypothetical protein
MHQARKLQGPVQRQVVRLDAAALVTTVLVASLSWSGL